MKNLIPYTVIFGIPLSFCVLSLIILSRGHLHEDAYILLQYVKNLANGDGIVFDHVSGHAEGATDFLWMVLLAGCVRLGLDPAISAMALNALGLGAIAFVLLRIRGVVDPVAVIALILVGLSGGTAAALGGFSSLFFAGVFSLVVLSALQHHHRAMAWLALLLSLVRPEGVILSAGVASALYFMGDHEKRRRLAHALILPSVIGMGYFLWRLSYFGFILPLPLLVKSKTTSFAEGLLFNELALQSYLPLLLPPIIGRFVSPGQSLQRREVLVLMFGPLILFVSLLFVHQSQNVGFRFQFPIVLSLIFLFAISTRGSLQKTPIVIALAIMPCAWGLKLTLDYCRFQTTSQYMYSFPQLLRANGFTVERLAVTEAGRLPYWYDAPMMVDLVGLNSPLTVIQGPKAALEKAEPELVLVHHAGTMRSPSTGGDNDLVVVEPDSIIVQEQKGSTNNVQKAPIAALEFARTRDYRAVFVRYTEDDMSMSHVYFISPKLNFQLFLDTLKQSRRENMTYFESLRRRFVADRPI